MDNNITLWCNDKYLGEWYGATPLSGDSLCFKDEVYRVVSRSLFGDRITINLVVISQTRYEVKEAEAND